MLKWFFGKFSSANEITSTDAHSHQTSAVKGFFKPLSADELLFHGERKRALQQLWEGSPFSKTVFDAFWLSPVRELAIRVQQLPAAQSGPYARECGFLDEALDTAVCAVRLSRGWMLPPGAAPEEQATQSSAWTTAIFYAALLHDMAALNAMEASYENGSHWYAGLKAPTEAWRLKFGGHVAGKTLSSSSMLAYRLLPDEGLSWISRWPRILDTLTNYLSGNAEKGDILHAAVTEARLKLGLSSTVANTVMRSEAVIQPNDGTPLQAELINVNNESAIRQNDVQAVTEHTPPLASSIPFAIIPDSYNPPPSDNEEVPLLALASAIEQNAPEADEKFIEARDASPAAILNLLDQFTGQENLPDLIKLNSIPERNEEKNEPELITTHVVDENQVETSGEEFWNWLVPAISKEELSVNNADSLIHRMSQYIFVQTPDCFFRFITEKNRGAGDKDEIQKSFESLNLHFSRNGKGIYIYRKYESENREGRYSKISGYMLPVSLIFTNGAMPPDSPWLSPNK